MSLPDVRFDTVLQLFDRLCLHLAVSEQGMMNVFGTELAGTADNNPPLILFPFKYGARADSEFPANLEWN
jgi:hypothetical protein